jgi:thiamine-phosphate diphosphorylase
MTSPLGPVHAIVDLGTVHRPDVRLRVRTLLAEGLPSLQLRGVACGAVDDLELGRWLRQATRESGARFIVNRDPALAVALSADGVHLRADGPPPSSVRAVHPGLAIGVSCHDETELARAEGADWVFLGPVFPTESKPGARGLGLERFAALVRVAPAPVYALGGVTAARYAACLEAGAVGVAVIRAAWEDSSNALLRAARGSGGE